MMQSQDGDNIINFSPKLNEHIKSIVEKEGYIDYNISKKNISSDGGGYMGTLFAIDVKGKTRRGEKETNIFIKQIVQIEIPMIYDVKKIYKREAFVYTVIFKEMDDLQEKEHILASERFKIAKVFDECYDEAIILENLVAKGFKTYYRMDIVKLEYAELAVKNLARLHGLSLAMKVKRPDFFKKNIEKMDCVYDFNDYFHGFTHNMLKIATQFLADDVIERVAARLDNLLDKYPSYMNDSSCQVKTICHGDFRHNNIMVKELDDKPIEVIAVDYQITFYGNPVLDFIYFIFWGTDQEFRKKHLEHLKQIYYQCLGMFMGYFDLQLETVFPKKEFERQYQEKLDFGLMISVLYLPYLFPPEQNVPNFSTVKEPLNELVLTVDTKYIERFRGIIDDFIQWGYI